jgi:hypothetical protein
MLAAGRAGISFIGRVSTLHTVILGPDPGIRCIGGAGEGVEDR